MAKRIIFKENGLSSSGVVPDGYKMIGYDANILSEKTGATISFVNGYGGGGSQSWVSYTANLSQSGTGNPSVTVFENSIGEIVWTRLSTGLYKGTLSNAFSNGKVYLNFNCANELRKMSFYHHLVS